MSRQHRLGDLQLAIMRVLWRSSEASVSDVHRALIDERGLAPTTIATMLTKMEAKGVVTHRSEGRRFIYRPTVSEDAVRLSMVGELTDRLFGGNPAALVSHLLAEYESRQTSSPRSPPASRSTRTERSVRNVRVH